MYRAYNPKSSTTRDDLHIRFSDRRGQPHLIPVSVISALYRDNFLSNRSSYMRVHVYVRTHLDCGTRRVDSSCRASRWPCALAPAAGRAGSRAADRASGSRICRRRLPRCPPDIRRRRSTLLKKRKIYLMCIYIYV